MFKSKPVKGHFSFFDRKVCAEAKLFEETAFKLKNISKEKVRINLYSENFPCESCLGIIAQFSEVFKNIDIELEIYSGK